MATPALITKATITIVVTPTFNDQHTVSFKTDFQPPITNELDHPAAVTAMQMIEAWKATLKENLS